LVQYIKGYPLKIVANQTNKQSFNKGKGRAKGKANIKGKPKTCLT